MKTSEIILHYKETILHQWISRVKEQVPEAREQGYTALRNNVPDLLEDIAANINTGQAQQDTHESFDHGRLRAAFDNYSLAHVIREYRVLMDVVLETIDAEGTASISDRDQVIKAITQAIEYASEVFFQDRQEEIKVKKEAAEAQAAQLQEESQLRDDFIGMVTHDLRNPLANIASLAGLLNERLDDDPTHRRMLDAIQTSANGADGLIRNLLDVNLIRLGRSLPVTIRQDNLPEVIHASVTTFQGNRQREVRVATQDCTSVGYFDREALRRGLDNLISNAIKYGEGDVTVRCQKTDDTTVNLSVHNFGNPIPADQQTKIFSRYYRMEDQQSQQGWGIGLSLVKEIAQAHGGTVALSSSEAEGTTFTINIPIHERR